MVLYNLKVFCSDMKFKMAATAGLSLTLDPMGKKIFEISANQSILLALDHPRNIPAKFGSNRPSGFGEEA
jgi:hypothetical protein